MKKKTNQAKLVTKLKKRVDRLAKERQKVNALTAEVAQLRRMIESSADRASAVATKALEPDAPSASRTRSTTAGRTTARRPRTAASSAGRSGAPRSRAVRTTTRRRSASTTA